MPDITRVVDKYEGIKFSELEAEEQKEFLYALCERSAMNTLKIVGLDDASALQDMRDIRSLISGYRAARSTVLTQMLKTAGIAITIWLILTFFPTEKAKAIINLIQ